MYCVLGTGHWALGTGYWVLGTGYWVLGTGYWVLGTGYWVLGTGYWVLGTGYWVATLEICFILGSNLRLKLQDKGLEEEVGLGCGSFGLLFHPADDS